MKETWVVPINPKYFDLEEHLKSNKTVAIKKLKRVQKGDIVYIYLASPLSCIKYKGEVIDDDCKGDTLGEHDYLKTLQGYNEHSYFLVKIEKELLGEKYSYKSLKNNGIGQVQVLARASRILKQYLFENE